MNFYQGMPQLLEDLVDHDLNIFRISFEENFEKAVVNQTDIPDVFKCLLIHNL